MEKQKRARKTGKKNRKWERNKLKCATYRRQIGKPRGPGQPGNKSGAGWLRRS